MPGYVIHLAEAEQILDRMGCVDSKFVPDNGWKQRFLTGTLLPDTRLKGEKRISHFWNPDHLERLALAPDLSLFLKKYGQSLSDPLILGYLAHLHLDTRYVESYWPTVIQFFGAEGEPEVRRDRITDVEIRHLQIRVPVSVFFSGDYYYGDYSKMNGYFIHKYGLTVPKWEDINDFKMNEVRLKDMERICCELEHLLLICHAGDEQFIQVFDLNCLEQFITETAYEFVRLYKNYLR